MKTLLVVICCIGCFAPQLSAKGPAVAAARFAIALDTSDIAPETAAPPVLFTERRMTATIYSTVMPGSGQTMLGSPYKGFGFTFVAFGSALTTLISHNNFVASNERMDALEFQYKSSTTWESSSVLYGLMQETHEKLNNYKRIRNTFAVITAIVWTVNIADVILNTEDEGSAVFSGIQLENTSVLLAGSVADPQQRIRFSIPLQ